MTPADVLEGRARFAVVHGDCLDVLPTLPDKSVAHVITDPPYSQKTSENARRSRWNQGAGIDREGRFIEFDGVDPEMLAPQFLRVSQRWVLAFCALEQLGRYEHASGGLFVRSGVWDRTNGAPQFTGDRPAQGAEGVAIMHSAGRKRWNGGGARALWPCATEKDGRAIGHPTPKPIPLMLELVELFTDPGDIVLDPFCGGGTTGVACLRLGRRFIGVEKDAKYAQLSVDRLTAESQQQDLSSYRAGQLSMFGGA